MNENPGETSNPLNPNNNQLDANPADSTPLEEIVEEVQTVNVEPASDPMARPMEKAPVAAAAPEPKKKKTGLIIAIVVAAVLVIGGIVAAIVLIMNSGDPVVKAIDKIASGNAPSYVAADGTITVTPTEENSIISSIQVDLGIKASTSSMLNSTTAKVTANFSGDNAVDFSVDEIYGADGNLYLKVSGLTNALEDYATAMQNAVLNNTTTDCIEDENGETVCNEETVETTVDCETAEDCAALNTDLTTTTGTETDLLSAFGDTLGIVEAVDGEWLRISVDDINNLFGETESESEMTCLAGVLGNINSYNNGIAEAYKNNQFISSTTEGVNISSRTGEAVRKVVIDSEKYTGFANAMQNSSLMNDLNACVDGSADVDTKEVTSLSNLPTLYVEVDKDNNFGRLYFETTMKSAATDCSCPEGADCDACAEAETTEKETANVKVDFVFTYPNTIDVAEPTEYKDLSTLLQELMMSMYTTTTVEETVVAQ